MPVAGFCKPVGIGLKPMTAKCLTRTRHDRGSKLKLLAIAAGMYPYPYPCTSLLHGTVVVGVSQTSAEGATYIGQGGHHVGHWPTF